MTRSFDSACNKDSVIDHNLGLRFMAVITGANERKKKIETINERGALSRADVFDQWPGRATFSLMFLFIIRLRHDSQVVHSGAWARSRSFISVTKRVVFIFISKDSESGKSTIKSEERSQ